MLQWLLAVAQRLEYEGICANGELLLQDVLDRRDVCSHTLSDYFESILTVSRCRVTPWNSSSRRAFFALCPSLRR